MSSFFGLFTLKAFSLDTARPLHILGAFDEIDQ